MEDNFDFEDYFDNLLDFSVELNVEHFTRPIILDKMRESKVWKHLFNIFDNVDGLEVEYIIDELVNNNLPHMNNISVDELAYNVYSRLYDEKIISLNEIFNKLIKDGSYIQEIYDVSLFELISIQYVSYIKERIFLILRSKTYNIFKNARDFMYLTNDDKEILKIRISSNIVDILQDIITYSTNLCLPNLSIKQLSKFDDFSKLEMLYSELNNFFNNIQLDGDDCEE